jgi:2-dehydropantoate 2-reductase
VLHNCLLRESGKQREMTPTDARAQPAFDPQRIAVVGAGAVGCYYGAVLARAGRRVTLVGRPQHVEAITRDGVTVLQKDGEWKAPAQATTDIAAVRDADLVLVCVKTLDTTDAAREIAPHIAAGARVLSMQNGVDNASRIGSVLPSPTYAAVVYVGAYMDGPGRVRHTGRGELLIGVPRTLAQRGDAAADLSAIAAMFEAAGIQCSVSFDVEAALWTKLAINCAFNAISALGRARYGRLAACLPIRPVVEEAVHEVVNVARADGVILDAEELIAATWKVADGMQQQFSSTAQDVERGKATEIDALNGFVVDRARALGVPAPVNSTLHALVKLREGAAGV